MSKPNGRSNTPRRQTKQKPGKKFKISKKLARAQERADADRRIKVDECAKAVTMST